SGRCKRAGNQSAYLARQCRGDSSQELFFRLRTKTCGYFAPAAQPISPQVSHHLVPLSRSDFLNSKEKLITSAGKDVSLPVFFKHYCWRILLTIAVVEQLSTRLKTLTVPPYPSTISRPTT